MLEGVSAKIGDLTSEKTNLPRTVKENSTVEKFNLLSQLTTNKVNKLSKEIKKRQQKKYDRDDIRTLE